MEKLLSLVFGLAFLVFGTTAFAEITADEIIDLVLEKQSMDKSFDMSLLEYDDNGNLLVYDNDGVYEPEIPIVPENAFRLYQYKKPTTESVENYNGGGLIACFKDFPREEKSYPYQFIQELDNGEHRYVIIHPELLQTYIGINTEDYFIQTEEAAMLLNEEGIQEIYDVQLVNVSVGYNYRDDNGNLDSECHYDNLWFDTDKGEYVVTRVWKPTYRENNRYSRISTMQEFLDFVIWTNSETTERLTSTTVIEDENGDEVEIEKELGWVILDETQDPSKKTDGVEDTKEPVEEPEVSEEIVDEEPKVESEDGEALEEEPEDIEDEQPKEEPEQEPVEEPIEEPEDEPKEEEKPEKTGIDVVLFGEYLDFPDQKPIIENDRVLVPFRVIFEALEADVSWDGETRTVTATKGDITITLTIGKNEITKNGEAIAIDVPAQIQNSRTLVPIRVVSESFRNTVSWDGENRIVEIE